MSVTNARFMADIRRFTEKAGIDMGAAVKRIAVDMYDSVEKMSPVRSGMFRGAWQIGLNDYPDDRPSVVIQPDVNGPRQKAKLQPFKIGDAIWISNNMPYARRLEYDSWSDQAPMGMVRITVMNTEAKVQGMARAV